MKNFIVYNDIGDILRTGVCTDNDFEAQAQEGEHVIEGACQDDENHKIINGELVYRKKQITLESALQRLRAEREQLLKASDWTQIPDNNLDQQVREQYKRYRQALRDLPGQYDNISDIESIQFPQLEDF